MNKNCKICRIELTKENAAKKNAKYYRNICKPCNSKRAIEYQKNNSEKRKIYINEYVRKIGRVKKYPCETCGMECYKKYAKAFCSDQCRFLSHVDMKEDVYECWLWKSGKNRRGYGKTNINSKNIAAHRMSYMLFKGELPDDKLVCHTCDNPSCVKPAHLWLGTTEENTADMVEKKRSLFGEKHSKAKITVKDVIAIRELGKEGIVQEKIAQKFGLTSGYVNSIIKKRVWKYV